MVENAPGNDSYCLQGVFAQVRFNDAYWTMLDHKTLLEINNAAKNHIHFNHQDIGVYVEYIPYFFGLASQLTPTLSSHITCHLPIKGVC